MGSTTFEIRLKLYLGATTEVVSMDSGFVMGGRDSILVGIPLIGLLFGMVFRVDEAIAPKRVKTKRPPRRGVDRDGQEIYTDPDGTLHRGR